MPYWKQCPRILEANGLSEEGQMEHGGRSHQIGLTYIGPPCPSTAAQPGGFCLTVCLGAFGRSVPKISEPHRSISVGHIL